MEHERKKIPIVFCGDDGDVLALSIALQTLVNNSKGVEYDIFICYSMMNKKNMRILHTIVPIQWRKMRKIHLSKIAEFTEYLNIPFASMAYRYFIHDVITEYEKVIYIDVNVIFQNDILEIYHIDMMGLYWAGVIVEKNSEHMILPQYLKENHNDYIYSTSFMVMNLQKIRNDNILERIDDVVDMFFLYKKKFDMTTVFNVLCQDSIGDIPLEYCIPECVYYRLDNSVNAPIYHALLSYYAEDDINNAVQSAVIIVYDIMLDISTLESDIKMLASKCHLNTFFHLHPTYLSVARRSPLYHRYMISSSVLIPRSELQYVTDTTLRTLLSFLKHYFLLKKIIKKLCRKTLHYLFKKTRMMIREIIYATVVRTFEYSHGKRTLLRDAKNNVILLIEPNKFHAEVMPGYAKYLLDLGYEVHVVMLKAVYILDYFCRYKDKKITQMCVDEKTMRHMLRSKYINLYHRIIVTSYETYDVHGSFFKKFKNKKYRGKYIVLVHHNYKDIKEDERKNIFLTLAIQLDRNVATDQKFYLVNTHYVGNVITTGHRNDIVKIFIPSLMIGEIHFYQLLKKYTQEIIESGIDNFEIMILDRAPLTESEKRVREYSHIYFLKASTQYHEEFHLKTFGELNRITCDQLYDIVEKSDFIMPVLDATDPKYLSYTQDKISGAYNLAYGCNTPIILHTDFAHLTLFNNNNSLLFDSNSDLKETLLKAITMDSTTYQRLKAELQRDVDVLYKTSLTNLEHVIAMSED